METGDYKYFGGFCRAGPLACVVRGSVEVHCAGVGHETLHARSLAPLVKARGVGMTPQGRCEIQMEHDLYRRFMTSSLGSVISSMA
jgi:hypothetical protein